MKDYSQPGAGKISLHGNGVGAPSPEEVEKRAREIAMIDERNPDEFTDADWAQARQELLGAEHPTPPEETKQNAELTEEWYVAAASRGHRALRPGVDEEEETVGEHLVTGGVEEATHDQMVEARREELEQEGGMVRARPRPPLTTRRPSKPAWMQAHRAPNACSLVFIRAEISRPPCARILSLKILSCSRCQMSARPSGTSLIPPGFSRLLS